MNRFLFIFSVAFIMVLQAPCFISSTGAKTQFIIAYTNDVMGEVEPCG